MCLDGRLVAPQDNRGLTRFSHGQPVSVADVRKDCHCTLELSVHRCSTATYIGDLLWLSSHNARDHVYNSRGQGRQRQCNQSRIGLFLSINIACIPTRDQQLDCLWIINQLRNTFSMKSAATALAICFSLATAMTAQLDKRQTYTPCNGLGTPLCCKSIVDIPDVPGVFFGCQPRRWKGLNFYFAPY